MRLVVAIIQPTKLSTVREALKDKGIDRMTVCDAVGYGRQRGQTSRFRGNEYKVDLLRKLAIEIVIQDSEVATVIETIRSVALTGSRGEIGDGKIFVLPVAQVIDI
ncbi:MAG: P-II family nitrogen regulator [Rubripirellula sp.]